MRPFIEQELLSKLKYRRHLEEAYENIPQNVFPSDYPGGKAPPLKELRGEFKAIIEILVHQTINQNFLIKQNTGGQ